MINREELTTVALALALMLLIGRAAPICAGEESAPTAATPSAETPPAKVQPAVTFDLQTSDGSVVKASLLETQLSLKTEYGVLTIPAADIQRIEFATRFPATTLERVNAAIGKLSDKDYQARETASAELLALGEAAYPALIAAVESNDPEVVLRADRVLAQMRKDLSIEKLEVFANDVVFTERSQIEGTIDADSLKFETGPFGVQQIKLAALRRLGLDGEGGEEPTNVLPDPGSMMRFQGQTGKKLYFRVSMPVGGAPHLAVWGTDVYTLDSHLGNAAIHAGLLKLGQSKVVGVTILPQRSGFEASNRNGVTSMPWGDFPGAFRFIGRKGGGPLLRRAKL